MLPLAHLRGWLAASVLVVVAVVVASLTPGSEGPDTSQLDKLGHFLAYAGLAVWFGGLLARGRYWAVALGLALLGIGLEVLQELVATNRTGDPRDVLANVAGIGTGLGLSWWRTGGWALRMEAWLKRN
jgi:VanZ family protein